MLAPHFAIFFTISTYFHRVSWDFLGLFPSGSHGAQELQHKQTFDQSAAISALASLANSGNLDSGGGEMEKVSWNGRHGTHTHRDNHIYIIYIYICMCVCVYSVYLFTEMLSDFMKRIEGWKLSTHAACTINLDLCRPGKGKASPNPWMIAEWPHHRCLHLISENDLGCEHAALNAVGMTCFTI